MRATLAALAILSIAGCGGGVGFRRPDYAAQAQARCDEADAAGDPERALSLYGMALEADPRCARAYLGRARVFEATGRGPHAERAYAMAVESAPDDVRPRYLLARAQFLRKAGRIEPAVRELDKAVGLLAAWPEPEVVAETRLLRAECRIFLHAWDGAREDLDAADRAELTSEQRERSRSMRIRVDASKPEERR